MSILEAGTCTVESFLASFNSKLQNQWHIPSTPKSYG
jgi:hypothetical protein